jgi:hypothetical protein
VSIVAILTLEVTGIPELSEDREFPWPKPAFIDRQTRSTLQMFEVSKCSPTMVSQESLGRRLKIPSGQRF